MQEQKTDNFEELTLEDLELVSAGMSCWNEYVWADGPRMQCRRDPWDGPSYRF